MRQVVKVLLECVIRFSIYFRWYAFPNFCTQMSRPFAYVVRISSKASATAVVNPYALFFQGTLGLREISENISSRVNDMETAPNIISVMLILKI